MNDIDTMVDAYWRWLRDKTALKQVKDWIEITTPYLDRHNDYIQIYVKSLNGEFILTDDGWTLQDLLHSGCNIDSQKRQQILKTILNGFGVVNKAGALQIHATVADFALRKHNLIQAMLAVNDMFFLATPTVEAIFAEDVAAWMDENDIRYTPQVKFSGKTGFDHMFDFVIPKSRREPERIIRAINTPNRTAAQNLILAWHDTRDARAKNSMAFAFLNDNERSVPAAVKHSLENYEIKPVPWMERDSIKQYLAA